MKPAQGIVDGGAPYAAQRKSVHIPVLHPAAARYNAVVKKRCDIHGATGRRRRISRHPRVCGGEPVLRGTRVTLRTVLASLAEGASIREILRDFPTLTEEDVRAVIAFAAASAEEDLPVPGIPVNP